MQDDQERMMTTNDSYLPIYTGTTLRLVSIKERERREKIKIIRNAILVLIGVLFVGVACYALYENFVNKTRPSMAKSFDKELAKVDDNLKNVENEIEDVIVKKKEEISDEDYFDNDDDNVESTTLKFLRASVDPRRANFNDKRCGESKSDWRVGHGNIAAINQFPWVVALFYLNKTTNESAYGCGGSLIGDGSLVLTAAHCLKLVENIELQFIRLGELDMDTAPDCNNDTCTDAVQEIYAENLTITIHPNFNASTRENDIALIHLKVKAKTDQQNIKTICLPFDETELQKSLILTGFGTVEYYMYNKQLRFGFVKVVPNDKCEEDYLKFNTTIKLSDSQFCALGNVTKLRRDGPRDYNVDSCKADSGSPVHGIRISAPIAAVQFGIVSGGSARNCGTKRPPGFYVNVISYLDWILDNQEVKFERLERYQSNGAGKINRNYLMIYLILLVNVATKLMT